jgi:hypothetical protein
LLSGIEKLTGMSDMRFRYFKSFKSQDASLENLEQAIPADKETYEKATEKSNGDNYATFFKDSYSDNISVMEDLIKFKRPFVESIKLKIIDAGNKDLIYTTYQGPIMLEHTDAAEVMFYTRYIGDYHISKVDNKFIFNNNNFAVVMERQL